MKRIAIFGGTFNPVHKGHTNALREILKAVDLDEVIIMPAKIPPHKEASDLASEQQRLEMCRLAFAEFPQAEVCDYELRREGKSYSVYTIRHIKEIYPEDRLYFIVGSDMLLTFHQWFEYEEILQKCGLICMSREDGDMAELEAYAEKLREKGEVIIIPAKPFEVSSTQIRDMLEKGLDCSCYLHKNVVQYITDNNLYEG